jgi:transposase-like protein
VAFDQKWGQRFSAVIAAWQDAWEQIIPFMA